MDRIFSGYRRLLVVLCIGAFVLACGQGKPSSAGLSAAQLPIVLPTTTAQPTSADPAIAATSVPPTTSPLAAVPQAQVTRAVNMRRGPGTAYSVIRTLPVNTTVDLIAVRDEGGERWYRVQADGDQGWVSASILHVEEAVADALSVDTQALAPPPTELPKPTTRPKPTIAPTTSPVAEPVEPSSGVRVGAICRDGTHSNATGRGACSHHGGVDHWLYQ
jgi:hypothetical protein